VEGKYLGEAIKILYPNKKFIEAVLDFVRDEEGSIMISMKSMSEEKSIYSLFLQYFVCIGSDGFLVKEGNTHPRSYGTFARILSHYIREKNLVSLEEGVRKMTSLPASILGIKDRGTIAKNNKADIVVFDFDIVKDTATYINGCQYPKGIEYVIVNGELVVDKGVHNGTLNGQIIKKTNEI
ncbi:MAG: amidohydrolase family protein, partial [archaeon]|nr:amidohydrolase family protein [archaeon]